MKARLTLTGIAMLVALLNPAAPADDGTWTNTANVQLWSVGSNWSDGVIADGADATAAFNTLDLAVDTTVCLDSARTIGGLVFGDTVTNSAAGWILDDNGNPANILTLAGTFPAITVEPLGAESGTNKSVAVNAVLAGSSGLTKAGGGLLTLTRANTYSGETVIAGGELQLDAFPGIPSDGLGLWLDATRGVTTNAGGNITVWADQSGNGRNATNAGSTGPTVTADINGQPTLRFTKSQSQFLTCGGPSGMASLTVFIVHKLASLAPPYAIMAADGWGYDAIKGNDVHINAESQLNYAINCDSSGYGLTSLTADTAQIDEILDTNGDYQLFLNGTPNGSESGTRGGQLKNMRSFQIGAWNAWGTNERFLDGSIGEILIYTRALGTAERQAVGVYLERKWGLSSSAYRTPVSVLPAATSVSLTNGASLTLRSVDQTVLALSGPAGCRVMLDGLLSVNGSLSSAYAGDIGGAGGFAKDGAGTLTLSGINSYTGTTAVDGGRLSLQNGTLASGSLSVGAGATLEYAVSEGSQSQLRTDLSGAGTLLKTGSGTLAFSMGPWNTVNWNFSSGAWIDVQQGTFQGAGWYNNNWTANHSSLNVAGGATFSGIESNVRVAKLTGQGTVKTGYGDDYNDVASTAFTVGVDDESSTFEGVIANDYNTGNLSKIGTGTLTLAGINTYTGYTAVDNGTLKIAGRLYATGAQTNAAVTVRSGGVLELDTWGCGFSDSLGLLAADAARMVISNGTVRIMGATFSGRAATVKGSATLDATAGANWNILAYGAPWAFDPGATLLLTGEGRGSFSTGTNSAVNILKTGTGKWTLTGTNTIAGPIEVRSGVLQVSASPASATPAAGAALWLDATRGAATNSSGHVTVWTDLSGNGHHAFNTASTGPAITADINGRPTLRFDPSQSQYLKCGGLSGLTNLTVFIVHKLASLPGFAYAIMAADGWGEDGNGGFVHINAQSQLNYAVYPNSGLGAASLTTGTTLIDEILDTNGDYRLFLNGTPNGGESGTRTGQLKNLSSFQIGAWNNSGANERFLDGSIGEILIYTRALNAAERQTAYNYLNAKWMIPGESGNPGATLTNIFATNAVVSVAAGATLDFSDQKQTLAALYGNGWVTNGTLTVTDAIAPGGIDQIGTLSFAQTLFSGTLLVDVTSQTSDRLQVFGDLDLSGATLRVANPNSLESTTEYVIATYSGNLTARFAFTDFPDGWAVRYTDDKTIKLVFRRGTMIYVR